MVEDAGEVEGSVALEIFQGHVSFIIEEGLDCNLITENTAKHKRGPLFQEGPAIDINIFLDQLRDNLRAFITTTDGGKVNTILALGSGNTSGVDGVLAIALEDLFDALEVALVAGVEELLLLLFLFSEVAVPELVEHGLELRQLINPLQDLVDFLLLINQPDLVFVKILNRENDTILIKILMLLLGVQKTRHVAVRRLQLALLQPRHVAHRQLLLDLRVL